MSLAHDEDAIQAAHDLLLAIILGEIPDIEIRGEEGMQAAADVLCWLLGHDHNTNFATNLARLELLLNQAGYIKRPLDPADEIEIPKAFYDDPED